MPFIQPYAGDHSHGNIVHNEIRIKRLQCNETRTHDLKQYIITKIKYVYCIYAVECVRVACMYASFTGVY